MNILLVLIPVTALVIGIGIATFFWAVNHQQFDDLDSPGTLPLLDDPDQEVGVAEVASSISSNSPAPQGTKP